MHSGEGEGEKEGEGEEKEQSRSGEDLTTHLPSRSSMTDRHTSLLSP